MICKGYPCLECPQFGDETCEFWNGKIKKISKVKLFFKKTNIKIANLFISVKTFFYNINIDIKKIVRNLKDFGI